MNEAVPNKTQKLPRRRFHILFALRYMRYGLLACLVPMVRALVVFDLPALFTALWQDLYILLAFFAVALYLWFFTGFTVTETGVVVERGFLLRQRYVFDRASVAALELVRPLHCRIFGAGKLTLYFKTNTYPRKYLLYLSKKTAQAVADVMLPVQADRSVFAPAGFEKLALVMLSANALTTWLFIWLSTREITDLFGTYWQEIAQANFVRLELLLESFLPAGLAMLTALAFLIISVTFLYAALHTAGFQVCRNGGVMIHRGGLITKMERRIAVSAISACDVRVTPVARLLGRYPLYVTAGSYRGEGMPVMIVQRGKPQMAELLLYSYARPAGAMCMPRKKSLIQYVWQPATCFAVCLTLLGVASWALPGVMPVLAVPLVLSVGCCAVSLEGFFREGVCKNENRSLSLTYTRFFTRHDVCIFTPDVTYLTTQHPMAAAEGRADFRVRLPCGVRYRVRGIRQYAANHVPFIL